MGRSRKGRTTRRRILIHMLGDAMDKDKIITALRIAAIALSHAAEENPMYQGPYEHVSGCISKLLESNYIQ